ncbi:lytic transglycosylase domain-containing protein [Inquilinus sp. CAU 1745]|uniref:lytic transglycosylase domain-containing protein n=1 Tax=Inquilinus sp. CAU 1745 TaxID=3140369 RepID=UPI00325BA286
MPLPPLSGRRSRVAVATGMVLAACAALAPVPALAQSSAPAVRDHVGVTDAQPIDIYIAEAAARFGIPERWIRAVMWVESAGNPRAVSRAGAMGLMQIMPATWRELRARHGLGIDPFDMRDNVLAGAAYLRAMFDRFGAPGFLAAYNAGPARYAEHLATGRPLPRETRAYLAKLAPLIGAPLAAPMRTDGNNTVTDWRDSPLFVMRSERGRGAASATIEAAGPEQSAAQGEAELPRNPAQPNGLFTRPRAGERQ